jgi:hypothetical protein
VFFFKPILYQKKALFSYENFAYLFTGKLLEIPHVSPINMKANAMTA